MVGSEKLKKEKMKKLYNFHKVKLCYITYWKQWLALLAMCFLVFACSGVYAYSLTSCLLYTSPSPRDGQISRMPSSA